MSTGGAAQAERSTNRGACLRFLAAEDAPRTVGEISQGTGLSRPTVHAVLDDLVASGPVTSLGPTTGGPGRPARAFRFARESGLVAGVDLGPRGARAILCDLSGRRIGYAEMEPDRHADLSAIPRALEAAADGLDLGLLRAVGVGLPGVVEADGELRASLAMPELVGQPVARSLAESLGVPVVVDNDIKLAALAEQRGGAGRGYLDVVYIQIGHRVSVSIVLNGVIRQGHHRLAGELGAQRGMRWTRDARRGQLVWSTRPTSAAVLSAAAAGDAEARAEVEDFCAQIAGRIATVLLVVDPEVVVVRGGTTGDVDALLLPLAAAVERELIFPERPPFAAAALGREAVVLGAVGNAFDSRGADVHGVVEYPDPWQHITDPPSERTPT